MSRQSSIDPADPTSELPFFDGPTQASLDPSLARDDTDDSYADDELDDEFAPRPKARLGKLTVLLAAVLVAGLGFLGGVLVQKHHGSATTTAALGGGAGAAALRARTGGGGFAGGGGFGGGTAAAGSGSAAPGAASGATPTVIGTIVSVNGDTVVVKNFGGKLVTVTLSGDTTVTKAAKASDLLAGQTVSVTGSTGSDGTVSATAIGAQ